MGIFKHKPGEKYDDIKVKYFFAKAYKLYKKELYQPFINTLDENKFSKKFHYQLDLIASTTVFKANSWFEYSLPGWEFQLVLGFFDITFKSLFWI